MLVVLSYHFPFLVTEKIQHYHQILEQTSQKILFEKNFSYYLINSYINTSRAFAIFPTISTEGVFITPLSILVTIYSAYQQYLVEPSSLVTLMIPDSKPFIKFFNELEKKVSGTFLSGEGKKVSGTFLSVFLSKFSIPGLILSAVYYLFILLYILRDGIYSLFVNFQNLFDFSYWYVGI